MNRQIQIGGVYRHFKGFTARIITLATHTETGEQLVVYECKGTETAETTKTAYMPDRMKCFCQR